MKLLELLVQELPKRKGWQPVWEKARADDGLVLFLQNGVWMPFGCICYRGSDEVTREQYESALAAAKQPAWSGDGLPPVGCECEFMKSSADAPKRVKIIAHFQNNAAMVAAYIPVEDKYKTVDQAIACCFRAIRSEADKKRDAIIEALSYHTNAADAADLYKAIEAGEVKGVKLDV